MKYNAPFGSTDPNAPYVDRNTPGAIAGSRVPAAALEHTQREIMAVIVGAGLDPSGTDLTQLFQAIQKIIDAATGGAGDANYVLMTQARVRLPLFPEVNTADGQLAVISPSNGTVRLMPGYSFIHRGIFAVTTVQQDFVTAGSKTYHLRWNPTDGYVLRDLANATYNPGGLAEGSTAFDTTYDDMLIARVVTNASNTATITTLCNKSSLAFEGLLTATNVVNAGGDNSMRDFTSSLNWSRRPSTFALVPAKTFNSNQNMPDNDWNIRPKGASLSDLSDLDAAFSVTRYQLDQTVLCDYAVVLQLHFSARA
ncbi:hypothetical protein [Agrobacterium rosae]|uniref:hypothetical protein n=1 Tax=Agrobacterium rosae TaxID=1972867 RepID=UPI003BA10F6A